jgi:hypothetical protein
MRTEIMLTNSHDHDNTESPNALGSSSNSLLRADISSPAAFLFALKTFVQVLSSVSDRAGAFARGDGQAGPRRFGQRYTLARILRLE